MSKRTQTRWGIALAAFGFVVILVELLRYWLLDHAIHPWPVSIGLGCAFSGGWLINPNGAERWSGVLVDRFVTVVQALPLGRRATDKLANAGQTVVIPPTDEHAVPVAAVPPKPSAPPVPIPPKELATDPGSPDPNAGVGGIL